MQKRKLMGMFAGAAAVVGVWGGVASAHVTIDPDSAPQGAGDVVITFRVPNEQDSANTIGLRVQFPSDHPIAVIAPESAPGWTATTKTTHLATPITTDDGTFSDVVTEVDWTGGKIAPHQYGEFKVLAQGLPTGVDSIPLPAIQNYDGGVADVAWIEVPTASTPNPPNPAPVLTLTAAAADSATTVPAAASSTTTTAAATAIAAAPTTTSSSSNGLAVAGIVIGAIALVLAGIALVRARQSKAQDPDPNA